MPYFSAVFARNEEGWVGADADLEEAAGLDDIADLMREAVVETAGDTAVLLVEEEDEWFAVVRLDERDELRVFMSDPRSALTSELAAILYGEIGDPDEAPTEEPAGDTGLLADVGIQPERIAALGESTLPGEALTVIAECAGFADEYDRLR